MSGEIPQVADFEYLINNCVAHFAEACQILGEPLATLGNMITDAFVQTRDLIHYGLSNPQPPPDSAIMVRYYNAVKGVVEFAEKTRDPNFLNHFATVKEAITALAWLTIKPAPCQYIKDIKEAGDYFSIRVLTSNKGKEEHTNWVNCWNILMADLLMYVKSNFLTGFTWGAGAGRAARGPAPPPPPPPPPHFGDACAMGDGGRQALLAQLNQGSDITRSLRPVRRDAVPADKGYSKMAAAKVMPGAAVPVNPPKFVLEGRKWVVEHQRKTIGMTVTNDDMSQTLAMYNCEGSSLQVVNKINSVSIDSCKRTSVSLKSVISSVELIGCCRVKLECTDTVPLISLDNCDEVEIYLRPAARKGEIVASKSTSCNVSLVDENGDLKEHALPEQIKTVIAGDRLVSSVLEKN